MTKFVTALFAFDLDLIRERGHARNCTASENKKCDTNILLRACINCLQSLLIRIYLKNARIGFRGTKFAIRPGLCSLTCAALLFQYLLVRNFYVNPRYFLYAIYD